MFNVSQKRFNKTYYSRSGELILVHGRNIGRQNHTAQIRIHTGKTFVDKFVDQCFRRTRAAEPEQIFVDQCLGAGPAGLLGILLVDQCFPDPEQETRSSEQKFKIFFWISVWRFDICFLILHLTKTCIMERNLNIRSTVVPEEQLSYDQWKKEYLPGARLQRESSYIAKSPLQSYLKFIDDQLLTQNQILQTT